MISALLFDLDGTLFDSSEANIAAYTQAFREVGIDFDKSSYTKLFGLRFQEMMDAIAPDSDEQTRKRIKDLKSEYYQHNLQLVRPNMGLLALLQSCSGKFQTALVTTASRKNVMNLLAHFSISSDLFDCIVAGEDVQKGKPDPECYISAARMLQVQPDECCVFEDSDLGVTAAKAAGSHFVKVSL